jgi:D-3-phosphoglycerate dehydrogenase
MALGLGMKVRAYDLFPDPAFNPPGDFGYATLEAILDESDVISLHCPPGERPLIDAAALARMKPGVYLINTARAAMIDEAAVLDALETGKLRGFATDVYQAEPPEMTALLRHERVITTPHAGGYTVESVERATEVAVSNLLKVLG